MNDQEQEKRMPVIPKPILDEREYEELEALTERYEKLTSPGPIGRITKKASAIVSTSLQDVVTSIGNNISEQKIYEQALKLISGGVKALEEQVARVTLSEASIIKSVNAVSKEGDIETLEEVCRIRAYDVAKAANKKNVQHFSVAAAEGGVTGVAGFAGIPFNLVLSTFIYYRAVQSTAMSYGYDVKNDPAELVIASEVFANALTPASKGGNRIPNNVAKFMAISAAEGVKQTAKKTWTAMIERGGPALILAQMRALANAAAKRALENAGKKGLENSIFREIFEQIGRRLTLKAIQRAVPVVSAGIGAVIDTIQMKTVLQYADIFYHKRFLIEKQDRVYQLFGIASDSKAETEIEALEDEPIDVEALDMIEDIAGKEKQD